MAMWLLIVLGLVVVVVVAAAVALVWVLSGRARPGGVIDPNNDAAVQAGRASSERAHIQHDFGHNGPSI